MMNISAGDFKAHCLKLMDTVSQKHETLVITKRGVPVAKLVPFEERPVNLFGFMKDSVVTLGDLTQPLEETWNAEL